jgi:alkylhydroperoxidase/carboxymuconolactone decarboxylase family protein YurZ
VSEEAEQALVAALEAARARRGWLLPHHGLFRLLSPGFAEAYEAAYGTLALQPVALEAGDKEFVWMVITAVVGSATARHHVRRYREAGGGFAGVEAALRIAGFAMGRNRFDFAAEAWAGQLPGWDAAAAEDEALEALVGDLPKPRAMLGLLAACTARRDGAGVERYLLRARQAGCAEAGMAEAMCLTVQPAGLPNLVHAAGIWKRMIAAGAIEASSAFKAWAAIPAEGDPPMGG